VVWIVNRHRQLEFSRADVAAAGADGMRRQVRRRRPARGKANPQAPAEQPAAQHRRLANRHQLGTDEGHPVRQALNLIQVVGGHDHDAAAAAEIEQQVPDQPGRCRVEVRGRLVEQDDGWVVEQGPGQGQLLLHALGQHAGPIAAAIPEIEPGEGLLHRRRGLPQTEQPGVDGEVVRDRERVPEAGGFRQEPDSGAKPVGGVPVHFDAADQHPAAGGHDQAPQHSQCRRFAGAVRAEQAEDLAGLNLECHGIDGKAAAKPPDELRSGQHSLIRAFFLPRCQHSAGSARIRCFSGPYQLKSPPGHELRPRFPGATTERPVVNSGRTAPWWGASATEGGSARCGGPGMLARPRSRARHISLT
jgi:hypothetical protein